MMYWNPARTESEKLNVLLETFEGITARQVKSMSSSEPLKLRISRKLQNGSRRKGYENVDHGKCLSLLARTIDRLAKAIALTQLCVPPSNKGNWLTNRKRRRYWVYAKWTWTQARSLQTHVLCKCFGKDEQKADKPASGESHCYFYRTAQVRSKEVLLKHPLLLLVG